MKKFYILAAVALVASAACTKVEPVETVASEPAISFQVANYAGQTKAGETSLVDEGFEQFTTYAWYTSATNTDQAFMAPATVKWNSTAKEWAPIDRTYYWPKTGYVNFFSFAGDHLPDNVELVGTPSQAKAHYTTAITVATDDNILVADGAYGFFNNDAAKYKLDGVTKGVPTLFRHMLSRVKFDIKVDATDVDDTKNHWKVTVTSATVSYRNQGTLEVGFPATPSISLGADNKPTTAGQTLQYTSQAWTPAAVANATINNAADVEVETDGKAASAAKELIADSVVMPQTLDATNVTVALTYTLEHTYNGGAAVSEVVPIAATALTGFSPSIAAWDPNTIYTYHIIIKPAADNKILFDPAVETWAQIDTPTYTIE